MDREPCLTAEALSALRAAAGLSDQPIYLVGGAVRNLFLGRPVADLDLAVSTPRILAKGLAKDSSGVFVVLDEKNAVFRVVLPERRFKVLRQIDVSRLDGKNIEDDLARRDFSVNAMAVKLSTGMRTIGKKDLIDPFGGISDLRKKIIRCRSKSIIEADPLRILRAFRIAAQLDFTIDPRTLTMISSLKRLTRKPAAERISSEVCDLLDVQRSSRWLRIMDSSGVLTALFPELDPARRCAQVYYGRGGVLAHSLETVARLDFLLERLEVVFPNDYAAIRHEMGIKNFSEASFPAFLRLTALLHDVAKPKTAKFMEGRLRFFRHDEIGAEMVSDMLKELRFSKDFCAAAAAVVLNHLRPGNLAANFQITRRAAYRFFRDVGERSLALLLTCWSDHASYMLEDRVKRHLPLLSENPGTFSSGVKESEKKTIRHLQVISLLMRRLMDAEQKPVPAPVIDGNDVMKILRIKPGPKVGLWLEQIREAQAEGKISSRDGARLYLKTGKLKPKKPPRRDFMINWRSVRT
ncbi:MAG: CCA tRNA nucleotidyltransferase [Elusimicrobiota bacterium]